MLVLVLVGLLVSSACFELVSGERTPIFCFSSQILSSGTKNNLAQRLSTDGIKPIASSAWHSLLCYGLLVSCTLLSGAFCRPSLLEAAITLVLTIMSLTSISILPPPYARMESNLRLPCTVVSLDDVSSRSSLTERPEILQ